MIQFTKLSGTGNDFILIDNRKSVLRGDENEFFQKICRRRTGIGADGILLIEGSDNVDFKMRYYNADGFEAEMCGNGARSCAFYAHKNGIADCDMKFEVFGEIYQAKITDGTVSLLMQAPDELVFKPGILEHENFHEGGSVLLGVPHYVLFCNNIEQIDVEKIGKYYCNHPAFAPRKTNVNFVSEQNGNLLLRTYERGVNAETLSCGTGTVSSAIFAHAILHKSFPVDFKTAGGHLRVDIDSVSGRHRLHGGVAEVYRGVMQAPLV